MQSGSLAHAYVEEARKFDKTREKYGAKYKTYTRKNGKSYTRRIPNALLNSVGATRSFPAALETPQLNARLVTFALRPNAVMLPCC